MTESRDRATQTSKLQDEDEPSFSQKAETMYMMTGLVTGTTVALVAIVCAGYAVKTWRNRWNS